MSIISVRNLTFCYEGSFDNIFENVNFTIDTDWRLGFIGRNGRGKTTFLRLLTGDYAYEGSITASVHFDYFPFAVTNESLTAAEILLTAFVRARPLSLPCGIRLLARRAGARTSRC